MFKIIQEFLIVGVSHPLHTLLPLFTGEESPAPSQLASKNNFVSFHFRSFISNERVFNFFFFLNVLDNMPS